jgi:peptidoglycan/xylan/chitin deacetylase (PgdA/CDA1 family)
MIRRRLVKELILNGVQYSGAEWLRDEIWARRGLLPAVVALFHRVTDTIPEDGITISSARFRQIVRTLKADYRPMSLSELVEHVEQKRTWPRRTVVVTFDDGYRCNYEEAAPILADAGVPATFFVVTELMGTDHVAQWDKHLSGRIHWMDWRQVRELAARGFEIASHTLTHLDLGRIRGAEARREIFDSRTRLEQELGQEVRHFAYPFGGRENLLPENRELVMEAGYRSCSSAIGGFVAPSSDIFNLRRIALNSWVTCDSELHFELRTVAPWRWRRPAGV